MYKRMLITSLSVILLTLTDICAARPNLIVVISLDQFPYTYLVRFKDHFGEGGFRYLMDNGANFSNSTYKHSLNMTGPGHAVILSGAYGNQNGIFANDWYNTATKETVYCVSDNTVRTVGAVGAGRSPAHFIGSTLGDELRVQSNFQSRVISISNKDRAAVLLGGKFANAAYWMVDSAFVTSSYYMNSLPDWVNAFNSSGLMNSYFGKKWERALAEEAYELMDQDGAPYENDDNGLGRVFPHTVAGTDTDKITKSYYYALVASPFGNEILASFVKEAIRAEQLGQRDVSDLLCISFSSNDYVGHAFGPHSHEVLDMAVRTDRILADLFAFIDTELGLRNCMLVLTSDHGVGPIPEYLMAKNQHVQAGRVMSNAVAEYCTRVLTRTFGGVKRGTTWINSVLNNNIYISGEAVRQKRVSVAEAARVLTNAMLDMKGIALAFTQSDMLALVPSSTIEQRMKRSFHRTHGGDVFYALKPHYIEGPRAAGHGEPYEYDAHVPLILVGDGIRPGTYATEASPADIAPTLSALLGIEFPSGREGRVLGEALGPRQTSPTK